jgi:hypothetical protein
MPDLDMKLVDESGKDISDYNVQVSFNIKPPQEIMLIPL